MFEGIKICFPNKLLGNKNNLEHYTSKTSQSSGDHSFHFSVLKAL